jgi:hypothetical protein
MRLSFTLILIFASVVFSSLILLNTYDGKGYIFSENFETFTFSGKCIEGVAYPVSVYIPPDPDVDVFGDFPKISLIYLSNKLSVGVKEADIVVPEEVFNLIENSTVLCTDIPVEFLSPSVLKVKDDIPAWELGGVISNVMNSMNCRWELPLKGVFKKGEIVSTNPEKPSVDLEISKFPGVGALLRANVMDFSDVNILWDLSGRKKEGEVLSVPPGEYSVKLFAKDSLGLTTSASLLIKVEDFQRVFKRFSCEIGVDCSDLAGEGPGVYVLKALKPYGYFEFIIDATETTYPKVQLQIIGEVVKGEAKDPNGAETFVFVNGRGSGRLNLGRNAICVVGVDPYDNISMESTTVEFEQDIRKILNIRSSFVVGWGR